MLRLREARGVCAGRRHCDADVERCVGALPLIQPNANLLVSTTTHHCTHTHTQRDRPVPTRCMNTMTISVFSFVSCGSPSLLRMPTHTHTHIQISDTKTCLCQSVHHYSAYAFFCLRHLSPAHSATACVRASERVFAPSKLEAPTDLVQ